MKPSLITIMTSSYSGGIGRSVANLSNALNRLGYRVDILVDRPHFPYSNDVADGVEIRHLKTSHRIGGIPHLLTYLKEREPAVTLTPFVQLTLLTMRTRGLFKLPFKIFTNIHSTYSVDFEALDHRKRERHIHTMKKYYPECDGLIAVSEGVGDDFSRLTGIERESIRTICNPIVTDDLIRKSMEKPNHPWYAPGQPPVLIGFGRMVANKNFHILINAFNYVRTEKECRLVLLGDGPARQNLEILSRKSPYSRDIIFLGHQSNPFPYLRYSSLFVLPSKYEGLPSTLIESLAVGTPVVSTDCPHGPREILEGGRFGELVPVNDPAAMSKAIIRSIENPLDGSTLKTAAERFRDTRIARSYLSTFGLI